MQFSLKKLLIVVFICAILLALQFAAPNPYGFIGLSLISLFVIPPVLWAGLLSKRGPKRAFIVGCILAGIPHFLFCVYFAVFGGLYFGQVADVDFVDDEPFQYFQYVHFVAYLIGLLGGVSGLAGHYFWRDGDSESKADGAES